MTVVRKGEQPSEPIELRFENLAGDEANAEDNHGIMTADNDYNDDVPDDCNEDVSDDCDEKDADDCDDEDAEFVILGA